MAQRNSGYARQNGDSYWTPQWVYDAILSVEPGFECLQDVAPREPKGYDFLSDNTRRLGVCTNPPFSMADQFCTHALDVTYHLGKVAMLLPNNYDTAKGRRGLWHRPFKAKYILTRRIRWENLEQKKAGPSTNHAWYVWDWKYDGPPLIGWLP